MHAFETMCDSTVTSDIGLIQSVSSPVLSLLGAAALTPKKENTTSSNKQQIFQFPTNPLNFTTHNNPHNNTHQNSINTGIHHTFNQDAMQIPTTINFNYNNTNTELKYRSIDSCTQSIESETIFSNTMYSNTTAYHHNTAYNNIYDLSDEETEIPPPIQWIGKQEFIYDRRISSSSTTSTTSATSATSINTCSSSATTFPFNNDEIDYNYVTLQDEIEGGIDCNGKADVSPIYHIQIQPLAKDLSQIDGAAQLIEEESYETESESDRDDNSNRVPSPKTLINSRAPAHTQSGSICNTVSQTTTNCIVTPSPSVDNIDEHDDDNIDIIPLSIQFRKQSTQKLLKDIDYTIDKDEDDEETDVNLSESADSTLDYNSTVLSSPKLKPSPSALDELELPPLPGQDDGDTNCGDSANEGGTGVQNVSFDDTNNNHGTVTVVDTLLTINEQRIIHFDQDVIENDQFDQKTTITLTKQTEFVEEVKVSIPIDIPQKSYQDLCAKLLIPYDWQKQIPNEQNYGAYFPNFQKEIMKNPFFKLSAGDFNDVLKKCQFIRSRWMGEKIRSTRCGQYGKAKWGVGEKIKELDLFAIKLYTDFEDCQRELKKCYRPPLPGQELAMQQYEQRYVITALYIMYIQYMYMIYIYIFV